jgi:hypothetical protein
MTRTHLNFLVDALAFAAMLLLTATGLVLSYQLPPGSGGEHGMGRGRGAGERPVTLLWGWSRHQWGALHYWIAVGLLAIVAVHLLLHWKWLVAVIRGKPSDASPYRLLAGGLAAIGLVGIVAVPLIVPTSTFKRGELQQQSGSLPKGSTEPGLPLTGKGTAPLLRGSMTWQEVSEETGVPLNGILSRLSLPADTSGSERVGRVLRARGLDMNDLRKALDQPVDEKERAP